MRLILLSALVLLSIGITYCQTYTIGATTTTGFTAKMDGQFIIGDSTFTMKAAGQEQVKKITNKTGTVIYITDGTSTDKVTITPSPGKIKGFTYTHMIVVDIDNRFNGGQLIYYCTGKP